MRHHAHGARTVLNDPASDKPVPWQVRVSAQDPIADGQVLLKVHLVDSGFCPESPHPVFAAMLCDEFLKLLLHASAGNGVFKDLSWSELFICFL